MTRGVDNAVYCWGENDEGQAGAGDLEPKGDAVSVGIRASIVKAGDEHTCAIATDKAVHCWGSNVHAQLGISGTNASTRPIPVPNLAGVEAIALGDNFSCALKEDGTVACWGENNYGQLAKVGGDSATPSAIGGISGKVESISAGSDHACVLTESKEIYCWGRNTAKQLGSTASEVCGVDTNNYEFRCLRTPARVEHPAAMGEVTAIALGGLHSCALTKDHQVWCWGENLHKQLGERSETESAVPGLISGLVVPTTVEGGRYHACALDDRGVVCWGEGYGGQNGSASLAASGTPVVVPLNCGSISR